MSDTMLLIYLLIINVAAFVIYGVDKYKAQNDLWRIPEKTLLLLAVAGGAAGAFLGMRIWHHKTKKRTFVLVVPLCLLFWAVLLVRGI